ncbi:MAG: hypothetical protein KJ799_11190 [Bacteroidetes bacterium]|nr:hypothetical protein [Bacteroidota bacterium]MBU1678882.1 hypothetical protein [Bacteroidota bacterium]MBU2507274.1 hypothetical protein [Bacteroidota bacterium]
MNQYIVDAHVKNGYLTIDKLPINEEMDVKVIVIPKVIFEDLSFLKVRKLTKSIAGNISDDINSDRENG